MLGEEIFSDLHGSEGVSPEDLADILIQDMTEAVNIDIPDVELVMAPPRSLSVAGDEDTEANIHTIMARLEQATDRARTALRTRSGKHARDRTAVSRPGFGRLKYIGALVLNRPGKFR